MIKLKHIMIWVAAMAIGHVALVSCSTSPIERAIRTALLTGDTTQTQFDSIASIIHSNPEQYQFLLRDDGEINAEALNALIMKVGSQVRPPLSWDISKYLSCPISLTIYFERSGSMVPYDTSSGRGQLKKSVNDMINYFPEHENVSIKIVNDNIYPYEGSIESFLQDRNIYASTASIGNPSYTDFNLIFNKILEAQTDGNISVLVTDMIYSPSNTVGVSAAKIFNEENSLATAIFRRYKGKSVIVNQLSGDYEGTYYPYNNNPFVYNGLRPFYLIMIADTEVMDRVASDPDFHNFLTPAVAEHTFRFNQAEANVNYCVIPDWDKNRGRFRISRADKSTLTNCEGDRQTDVFTFAIAADLKSLNKDEDFLTNAANYTVRSQNDFKIAIAPIEEQMINGNTREALSGKSHIITVTGTYKSQRDDVVISLRNEFPQWIREATSADDTRSTAGNFASTTFGLSHFMEGIFNAFSTGNDNYATIEIKLQK